MILRFTALILIVFFPTELMAETLLIKMQFDGESHKAISAKVLQQNFPTTHKPVYKKQNLSFQIVSDKNVTVFKGAAYVNNIVRGAYLLASERERLRGSLTPKVMDTVTYYLRVPNYNQNMTSLTLEYGHLRSEQVTSQHYQLNSIIN